MLHWLKHEAADAGTPYSLEQEIRHQQQVDCLRSMANQLGSIKHSSKPDQKLLQEQGKWMDAVEVVMFVEKLTKAAKDQLTALPAGVFLTAPPRDPLHMLSALMVHDAVLASFNFGIPPSHQTLLYLLHCAPTAHWQQPPQELL